MSDYVSIKDILCPAINVLIAAEKENPLGAVNNGLLFIRGHSSEVGKPAILLSFHSDDNIFTKAGGGLASVNPANNRSTSQTSPAETSGAETSVLSGSPSSVSQRKRHVHGAEAEPWRAPSAGDRPKITRGPSVWVNFNLTNHVQISDITARTLGS